MRRNAFLRFLSSHFRAPAGTPNPSPALWCFAAFAAVLISLAASPARAQDSTKVCRAPSCRSSTVAHRFMRLTGHPNGWPGHVVDHWHPLECGGADAVENLWWQTTAEAAAKDRLETQCSRWLPSPRSDGKPVPNAPIP